MSEKSELAGLVRQVQKGDLEAFGQLYDHFYGPVFAYVLHQVGSPADAEDIVSGVFLDALQKIGGFTWRGAGFGAWLFSIARNDVMDHFRRQGRSREAAITEQHMELAGTERVEKIAEAAWDERRLRDAVWQLPEEQQQVILMKLVVNFSNSQIAAVLSKSEGAVKALQHRALQNLRKIMAAKEGGGTALADGETAV